MKWFPGAINEAVTTSKSRKAIFVVFVAGTDEVSIEATKIIDTPEISSALEKDDFVAIRLESESESYRFFAQIYQLVPVPSLFFIGENGKPLEIVVGKMTPALVVSKIESVLSKAGKNISSGDFIKAEQSNAATTSSSQSSTSKIEPTSDKSSENKVQESVVEQPIIDTSQINTKQIKEDSPPKVTEASSSSSSETAQVTDKIDENNETLLPEDKIERAKKLIELQKQQRIEQVKEKEKLREKERREIGKQMQNARRQQQDLEMKLIHEERKKEKAAELEARERIRQQIAQDKLERKQREQTLLQQTTQQCSQERPNPPPVFPGDGNARIQFRLPSGNPHTATFEATNTLRELRAYVINNIDLPFRQFALSMSFPRQDLNEEDDNKTLLELKLVPTAVILILPVKNTKSTSIVAAEDSSFLSRFMWALFAPILTVYNYLSGLIFGTQARDTNQQNDSNSSNDPSARAGGIYATSSRSNSSINQSTGAINRNLEGPNTTVRARGNVHRLHSGGDDNDENNTWNGNSTQQM